MDISNNHVLLTIFSGRTKKEIDAAIIGINSEELVYLRSQINFQNQENKKLNDIITQLEIKIAVLIESNLEMSNFLIHPQAI